MCMRSPSEYPYFRWCDLLLLAVVVILLIAAGSEGGYSGSGEILEIRTPMGSTEHSMSRDTTLSVPGALGDLTVTVRDDRARVAASPCRGQDCVRTGWIDSPGEISVCMPSGVYLKVKGGGGTAPDAVSY